MRTLITGCGLIVLFSWISAGADVIHLRKGGRLEGILVSETQAGLTMDVGSGRISIPRSSVARVERKQSALAEFRTRLAGLEQGDAPALADLARFAEQNGLRAEARLLWTRMLSLDPVHGEAHLALGHVLVNGRYVDEDEAQRARGYVFFEGRWMTPAEQEFLLRDREQRNRDERRAGEARRAAREEEDRERRAERAEERARRAREAEATSRAWGYGAPVIVGSPYWGGYTAGCSGHNCTTVPPMWLAPPAASATPVPPRVPPPRPRSIR